MPDDPLVHVIDDDDAVRESLDFLLSTAAFAVRTYETATRFLDTLSDRTSGCVVTDVRMPEMTGYGMNVTIPPTLNTGRGS